MNWYKKAQQKILEKYPSYMDIGHPQENPEDKGEMWLWISDLTGRNFHKDQVSDDYDHGGLAYDVGLNYETGVIQGRYDGSKNIISIHIDPRIASMRFLPNRLINRLKNEFGDSAIILDYSSGKPKMIV